jgi:hypothetical protein
MSHRIEVGFQTTVSDSEQKFGSVRAIAPGELTVYVQNSGDFKVPMDAVIKVGFGKVTLDYHRLDETLRAAIGHAHDAETKR